MRHNRADLHAEFDKAAELERELRASQRLYETLIMTSPVAITATDLDGVITCASARTAEVHGYTNARELIGLHALDLLVPEDHERARSNMDLTLRKGRVFGVSYTMLRKDGTRFSAELNASVLRDNGDVTGFIGAVRDVSKLKTLVGRWESMFHSTVDGIVIANSAGEIQDWNQAAERMFGWTKEEAIGQPTTLIIPPRKREDHLAGLEHYQKTGETKLIGTVYHTSAITRSGEEFEIDLSLSVFDNGDGRENYLAIIRDRRNGIVSV